MSQLFSSEVFVDMLKKIECVFVISLGWTIMLSAQQVSQELFYINQYKNIAIQEMLRTGIPASITLAQGMLESGWGKSELAINANNHFGIKCGSTWTGPTYYKTDDDFDENGELIKSCFRSYAEVESSFIDHSEFLTDPKKAFRYGRLFKLDRTDYQGWAYGLKEAGYATSETYPEKLIDLIQRYNLADYDLVFPTDPPPIDTAEVVIDPDTIEVIDPPNPPEVSPPTAFPPLVSFTNGVGHTFASGYETAQDVALRTNTDLERLLTYNEQLVAGYVLPRGEKIFLAPKERAYKGPRVYHMVENGQTMYDIAQKYGVDLCVLRGRNRLSDQVEPKRGELIKLSGRRVKSAPLNYPIEEISPIKDKEPPTTPVVTPPKPEVEKPTKPEPDVENEPAVYHTVEKSDTLWSIARRYGTTVERLKELNKLNDNTIHRGVKLRVK